MQSDALKNTILDAMSIQPMLKLVILFGSLASGNARRDSDLDVAIDAGHRLSAEEKQALIGTLAERTGRPVDLVDLRAAGEPLLGEILRQGKRLLGSDADYGTLIYRHLIEEADFLPYRNRILAERRRQWLGK